MVGRKPRPAVPPQVCDAVCDVVSSQFGVDRDRMFGTKGPDGWGTLARHIVFYMIAVEADFGVRATGRAFGRGHRTVSYGITRIEDRRDTPVFELALGAVTAELKDRRVLA